ncbi:hotdog family protein [Marinibacterium profundimaris]|uniref:phosphate acetyltransferase n=1 Tax=Marinibacterium profundimaris TaxID=1679460 RepID=UPI000B523307|nr:phosphate acetyltransferase [Marinibacterium profundimaris]
MRVGDSASVTRCFTAGDMAGFAAVAGAGAGAGGHVPEPLIGALFSYLLGVRLPGQGTNYLKQDMTFHAPAPVGTPLTATVEITRLRPDRRLVDLWARCVLPDGTLVCEGRALVKAAEGAGEGAADRATGLSGPPVKASG